jgi:serine/threonine protein kinase, bacterial
MNEAEGHPFLGIRDVEEGVEPYLRRCGEVDAVFPARDSHNTCFRVLVGGRRWFVKYAERPEAVGDLESSLRFHASVSHPAIIPVEGCVRTPQGIALIHEWRDGDILNDPSLLGAVPRRHVDSAFSRFRRLPLPEVLAGIETIIDAHVEVAERGFVAVDFYDGSIVYDFARHRLHLLDLDSYRPGPYVLERTRQYGSTRFMAPEEFQRGATIDERTTVYTLGRAAFVFLSTGWQGESEPDQWRASAGLYAAARKATATEPEQRFPSVRHLADAWRAAAAAHEAPN